MKKIHKYDNIAPDRERSAPSYDRTTAALSDADLLDELGMGKGSPEFQDAVRAEVKRRGLK